MELRTWDDMIKHAFNQDLTAGRRFAGVYAVERKLAALGVMCANRNRNMEISK